MDIIQVLHQKVEASILKHHMVQNVDHIVVGVSGGADSVCLLLVLFHLHRKLDFELSVVHVEHGLRGEASLEDERFTERLAADLGLEYSLYACSVRNLAAEQSISEEEAARGARYDFFDQERQKLSAKKGISPERIRVAVAHHQEDQTETMLFRMARGTGIRGCGGMSPVRDAVIRPLLFVSRREIEQYLQAEDQNYCTDQTNLETDYSRNKIRHLILPALREINPAACEHFSALAEELRETEEYLRDVTETSYMECVTENEAVFFCDLEKLRKCPRLIYPRILRRMVVGLSKSAKDISRDHLDLLMDLSLGAVGRQLSLPYEITAEKTYQQLILKKTTWKAPENTQIRPLPLSPGKDWSSCTVNGGKIAYRVLEKSAEHADFPQKKYTKWVDYDKIIQGLYLRNRQQGDFFYLNLEGQKQTVKSFMINEKIPRECRDNILLLADGNHIIWMVGYRLSSYYHVTKDTKRILELQYMEDVT